MAKTKAPYRHPGFATGNVREAICVSCDKEVLAWYFAGFDIVCDPTPLDLNGEAKAILEGRATYSVVGTVSLSWRGGPKPFMAHGSETLGRAIVAEHGCKTKTRPADPKPVVIPEEPAF